MPREDRTGPQGMGPMTGRGAGVCAGYSNPATVSGFGRRFGWGGGRGWRNRFSAAGRPGWDAYSPTAYAAPAISGEQEVGMLKMQAQDLQATLQRINDRLNELEKKE